MNVAMNKSNILARLLLLALSMAVCLPLSAGQWRPEAVLGGKLSTHVYVPSSAPALAGKRALMVSLHGCRQSNSDFKVGGNWQPQADKYGMVVALPSTSAEGPFGHNGCWDFHGGMQTRRDASDAKYLLDLVADLLADESLNLDSAQVYLTGLSSGGVMASTLGCLAPDVFAGIGANSGPGIGFNITRASLVKPNLSVAQSAINCRTLAAGASADFSTQLYSAISGTADTRVGPGWTRINTQALAALYGEFEPVQACGVGSLAGGGDINIWCDSRGSRVSRIMVDGMGHAWSAGVDSAGGGKHISHDYVNFPQYISRFFFTNNRRVPAVFEPIE